MSRTQNLVLWGIVWGVIGALLPDWRYLLLLVPVIAMLSILLERK